MRKIINTIKVNSLLILVLSIFGIIFSLISLLNHYNFRTNSGDLGIYNQAIYDYAHFRANYNTPWYCNRESNILSDHLTLLQLIFSPLYWVFKSYTLLIVQIISILLGGLGIYKYIKLISSNKKLSLLALIHFFSMWGIYSALGFDYHDSVVATMFIPWIIYFLRKEKFRYVFLLFTLFIISRENMIIWGLFLTLGLLFVNFKNKAKRNFILGLLLFSVCFLLLAFLYIMPSFTKEIEGYTHFSFSILGLTAKDAVINIIQHPWDVLVSFFTNHLNISSANGVKNEFFLTLIISGGFILIKKPQYLFILLPIFGQKLFHDTYTHWGLSAHYSIEFAPILTLALFEYFAESKGKHIIKYAAISTILCFVINIVKIENRLPSWYDSTGLAFYSKKHYQTPYNVSNIYKGLSNIPDSAKVVAESNLVPHLAARKFIYQYPRIVNAEYIVLLPNDGRYYPQNKESYASGLKALRNSFLWEVFYENQDLLIFKKRKNAKPSEKEIEKVILKIKSNIGRYEAIKIKALEGNISEKKLLRKKALKNIYFLNNNLRGAIKVPQKRTFENVLKNIQSEELVILSVKDEAANKMPLFFSNSLDKFYATKLSSLQIRHAYIAIFNKGKLIYEQTDLKSISYQQQIKDVFVEVKSVGGNDMKNIVSSIKIEGVEYSLNKRGLNIVSFNSQGIAYSYHFDTYANEYKK